jgi:hypothetical protein
MGNPGNPSEILPVIPSHAKGTSKWRVLVCSGTKPGFKGCIFISGQNLETLEATSVMLCIKPIPFWATSSKPIASGFWALVFCSHRYWKSPLIVN